MGVELKLIVPVKARTFISFISARTLNDPSFASPTVLNLHLHLAGVSVQNFTVSGTNAVWTTESLVTFDSV